MLVLSRKAGQKLTIGDNIELTIQRVAGGRVTLAIEAPRDIRILRSELTRFEADHPDTSVKPPKHEQAAALVHTSDSVSEAPLLS